MSQETKSEAFHRLAQARKEALLEKIRLFGKLSGPSYDWTPDEVWAYFGEITQALEATLARFQEQKRWGSGEAGEGLETQAPAIAEAEAEEPESLSEPEPETKYQVRKRTIGELIKAAEHDVEMLPEMLVLQREMITNLQKQLAERDAVKPLS